MQEARYDEYFLRSPSSRLVNLMGISESRMMPELKDHKFCAIGQVTNCSRCVYLEECRGSYESCGPDYPLRDKQLFKMVNPNA